MANLDEGFDPLPAATEPLDPDSLLAAQDALADRDTVVVAADPPAPLGRAPAFDFAVGQMVPGVAGGPLMTRGIPTLAMWIEKCLRTRRGESPAVDPDFGCDITVEDVLSEGGPFDASAVAEYQAGVVRALTMHPRIVSIEDLQVEGSPSEDSVRLSFHVTVDAEDTDGLTFTDLEIGATG